MRLLFLGDISVSEQQNFSIDNLDFFQEFDYVVANLEGPVLPGTEIDLIREKNQRVLYNAPEVIEILRTFQVNAVSLANNHIYDHTDSLAHTKKILNRSGIGFFGAGRDLTEAHEPLVFPGSEGEVKIFGFGWDVIGCKYAGSVTPGVNPLEPDHMVGTIQNLREQDPHATVIYYLHWNYELAQFPQPADRQLARKLINEGVDAVIGLHPHVPHGAELYRGKPIIYSLGNWFFPPREFGKVDLNFSREPSSQIAVELDLAEGRSCEVRFHWTCFDSQENTLKFDKTEGWDGDLLVELTPFSGLDDEQYLSWFKVHKKKRFSLPIYRDYSLDLENWIKDQYVKLRQQLIWLLVKLNLKK